MDNVEQAVSVYDIAPQYLSSVFSLVNAILFATQDFGISKSLIFCLFGIGERVKIRNEFLSQRLDKIIVFCRGINDGDVNSQLIRFEDKANEGFDFCSFFFFSLFCV